MKTFKFASLFLISLCSVALCMSASAQRRGSPDQSASRGQERRVAPPAAVKCPLDNLTVYEGRITSYSRNSSSTFIRIRTDYDTTETVTLRHRRERSPLRWFLLRAEPFERSDWKLIEARSGRLRPNMRANIWVCTDGRNPVVDWQPPQAE